MIYGRISWLYHKVTFAFNELWPAEQCGFIVLANPTHVKHFNSKCDKLVPFISQYIYKYQLCSNC